jgi:hypothetical protein
MWWRKRTENRPPGAGSSRNAAETYRNRFDAFQTVSHV